MIKGKTEIFLTDMHTGKQEQILEHNMMTNALNEIFKQEGYMKDASIMYGDIFQPPYQKLLGGILLFDKTIPENASTYFAPAGTNLTACGVYGVKNSTADTLRGDFNSDESIVDANARSVKYVYDFATSKGNGTIASVCLTSYCGGYSSYGAAVYGGTGQNAPFFLNTGERSNALGGGENIIAVDYTNDQVITFTTSDSNSYINAVTIKKRRAHMKTIPLTQSAQNAGALISTKAIAIDNIYSSDWSWNYDKTTNTVYLIGRINGSSVSSGSAFLVVGISLDTLTARTYNLTNPADEAVYTRGAHVYDGCLYITNNKYDKMYRIRLTDSSDFSVITAASNAFYYTHLAFDLADRIFIPSYQSGSTNGMPFTVIDTTTNTVRTTQSSTNYNGSSYGNRRYIPVIGNDIVMLDANGSYNNFCVPCNYLATINNLSAPVKKTESQTMKVIYTITEE